ncbi:ABC transporter substrate-binding protein, partial [Candidatus Woesearchaeota archaeon]|nr:ABC transporter substrate-binding protein [Candidatus Woesearchaeota archaeon]
WSDPKILEEVKEQAEGIFYSIPFVPAAEEFEAKMKEKTGKPDVTLGSHHAYDAINIVADIMKRVGADAEDIKNELYNVKDYPGVSGTIGFDENGDLESAEYTLKIIENGEAIDYEE